MKENRLEKLEKFLKNNFVEKKQSFTTRNTVGDPMMRIYDEDNIQVDYCHFYDYIEIFGLLDEEYSELLKKGVIC